MSTKSIDANHLPEDPTALRQIVIDLLGELDAKDRKLKRVIHWLENLLRQRYGRKREWVDPNQLWLLAMAEVEKGRDPEEAAEEDEATPKKKKKRKGHGRRPLPEHLERVLAEYDLAEDEQICSECNGALYHIGEEVSERLEYIPASLYVIREVCHKYGCKNGCQVVTAQKPMQPIEKGIAGPGLLAHVAVSKYGDHLPLNRQNEIFKRQGIEIARSTMCDWMAACAELVEPLYNLMKDKVLSSKVVQTDDTPVGVLDSELTRTKTGRIWTYVGDRDHPFTVYDYTPTRSRDGPLEFMKDYNRYLQADAYAGYDALFNDPNREVIELACWAHTRRKFYDAQSSDPMRCMVMLAWIRILYGVEREARELKLDSDGRLALRQKKSKSILKDIKKYLLRERVEVLPKSPEGRAMSYALSNWEALLRYCEDGDLEIDNNGAERSLRGIAVGRKNWMFYGSDQGGQTAAILTSFVSTCKRHRIDPYAYLRDIFERISAHPMKHLEELLPDRWKTEQEAHPTTA